MIIRTLNLKRYRLKLKKPLYVKGRKLDSREGIIAIIENGSGRKGYGEISPLPGFHNETLAEAVLQSEEVTGYICGLRIDNDFPFGNSPLERMTLFPSVRFGLEMAIFNIYYSGREYDSKNHDMDIPVNVLLDFGTRISGKKIKEITEGGFNAVKLKVGQKNVEADIGRFLKLRKMLPENIMIRLDSNGSWSLEQAGSFFSATGNRRIEYIEDPVASIDDYDAFYSSTGIPVAVDEHLEEYFSRHGFGKSVKFIILKPDLVGGFSRTASYIRRAGKNGIKTILSHCFLSGLGITSIAVFAAFSGLSCYASGLDKPGWLETDLLEPDFPIVSGKIDFLDALKCLNQINPGLLIDLYQ